MTDLSGKVVAITGATSGIGRRRARALAGEGAGLVLGGRRRERLDQNRGGRSGAGPRAWRWTCGIRRGRAGWWRPPWPASGAWTPWWPARHRAYGGIMDLSDEKLQGDDGHQRRRHRVAHPGGGAPLPRVRRRRHRDRGLGRRAARHARRGPSTPPPSSPRWGWPVASTGELREKNIRVSTICPGGVATEFAMGAGRTPDMPGLAGCCGPKMWPRPW